MQRHILGILGVIALAFYGLWFAGIFQAGGEFFPAMAMRLGLVCCAIWLAVPDFKALMAKYPPWLLGGIALLLVALVLNRSVFFTVAIVMAISLLLTIAVRFFGGKKKSEPKQKSPKS